MPPVAEETFFRGFLYGGLRGSWGPVRGGAVSAGLFGLAHPDLFLIVPVTLLGALLVWLYAWTGSLWGADRRPRHVQRPPAAARAAFGIGRMSRISETFQRLREERRTGIAVYVTVGFPDVAASKRAAVSAVDAGADIVELGVPFSDPLADGATIQRSSSAALEAGVNLGTCLETAHAVRAECPAAPILFFGYYNPILRFGLDRFAI